MLESFGGVKGVLFLLGGFLLVVAITVWQRQATAGAMAKAGGALGLDVEDDGLRPKMLGAVDGVAVRVETISMALGGKQGLYTRFRMTVSDVPPGRFAPRGLREAALRAVAGGDETVIGDEAFSRTVRVEGDPSEMLARLGPEARTAVAAAVELGWTLKDGTWEALESGRMSDAKRMEAIVRAGVAAAKATALSGPVPDALMALALTDPEPGVQQAALEARLRLGPLEPAEAEQVAARGGALPAGVGGAGAVEDEDLEAALADPERRVAAAIALARRGDDRSEVRMALVGALVDRSVAAEVIPALGAVGGAMERMTLQAVKGEHQALAEAAMAEIQARLDAAE